MCVKKELQGHSYLIQAPVTAAVLREEINIVSIKVFSEVARPFVSNKAPTTAGVLRGNISGLVYITCVVEE
jgi:hypothetical protein